jgi:signal transduction histidine kinase
MDVVRSREQRGDRLRRVAGWSLAVLTMLLFASIPLSLSGGVVDRPGVHGDAGDTELWLGWLIAAYVLSGVTLVQLRPRNWIGWLLIASALLQTSNRALDAYAARALTDPDSSLPWGLPATWVASMTWLPSLLLLVLVLPPIYPAGRPPSRFWVWHLGCAFTGIGLAMVTLGIGEGGVDDTVAGTELPWVTPVWLVWVLGVTAASLLLCTTATALVGTAVRTVRAGRPERQQLLLLLTVVAVLAISLFSPYEWLLGVAYGLLPIAVVVGVLRYRLLGIEVVLRRTLLYGPLTLLVALAVAGLTTGLARLVPDGPLPLVVASAVVAVLVFPVSDRLRRLVDRTVLGEGADPLALVDRVGSGLETASDRPVPAMLDAVALATGASSAAVVDRDGRRIAQYGVHHGAILDVALRHNGEDLGVLRVGPRRGEPRVTERDSRLVVALAPHLAVVVAAQQLTADLSRERERVTVATLTERDRLRRDLHDGLGPSLSGIALGLEAATMEIGRNDDVAAELLDRTRQEAESALREIRRVLDGLRPSALDEHDLGGAVRQAAAAMGMNEPGRPRLRLDIGPLPVLSPAVEESAFRIISESMTNVARHSGAGHCAVEIHQVDGHLVLGVEDDGAGCGSDRPGGHGLESMRRRAADLGGRLTVAEAEPTGTRVAAVLPLEAT